MSVSSVVIIGAGLSGLVAAQDCVRSGIPNVVVLEARDRIGGRLKGLDREGAPLIDLGGELVSSHLVSLMALATELGVEWEEAPMGANFERGGESVRVYAGNRLVEPYPLSTDPDAEAANLAFVEAISAIVETVVVDNPSLTPGAAELDSITLGAWIDEHVDNAAARSAIVGNATTIGDVYELSLLYYVWYIAKFGGWEEHEAISEGHFVGGAAQLPRKLAESLADHIHLSQVVTSIEHGTDGVVVHAGGTRYDADAVIVAVGGAMAAGIEFAPALPPAHAALIAGWKPQHGAKLVLEYDRAFWTDKGLAGLASGDGLVGLAIDSTPASGPATLIGFCFQGSRIAQFPNDDDLQTAMLADLVTFFGEEIASPTAAYLSNWEGDEWSAGCSHSLPPGVLTAAGDAVSTDVGRVVFAGSDRGTMEYMEGAVTAGQRAARVVAGF
ncbi:MAG TPA: FAD-dependent oxidoreductase [Pseudolysinimonas sp.]|nr:FAD-dependent oxidoreductase [Pseudolysinimonas sp.]